MADRSVPQSEENCYVYEILVDGVVRYVGKGSGRRYRVHLTVASQINRDRSAGKRIRTSDFYNCLARALRRDCQIDCVKVEVNLTSIEAFEREAKRIASYQSGQLWNETPGGDGFRIDQLSNPEAYLRKLRNGIKRSWKNDPGRRERHVAGALRRWADPQARESHSRILTEKWRDENLIARHRDLFAARFTDKEALSLHQSEVAKARWAKPGSRSALKGLRDHSRLRSAKFRARIACAALSFGC